MSIQEWSILPANNATGVQNINMQTGSAPSTVHPSVRQMMADVATWYASPEWIAQADVPTYTGATTFTVPGNRTGAFSVGRRVQALGTGYTLTGAITGSVYTTVTTVTVRWDTGSLDATVYQLAIGILQNQLTAISSAIGAAMPPGTLIDFAGLTAPAGFLACTGQAVSRTTYAALFAAIGSTWGAGDGSTTFNVPNLSRLTTIGAGGTALSGPANTVGAVGGEETHTLSVAELAAHNHGVNDIGHLHSLIDPGHNHAGTDPGHNHIQGEGVTLYPGRYGTNAAVASTNALSAYSGTSVTGNYTSTSLTGITLAAAHTGASIAGNYTGITLATTGVSAAHNNMQPSAVVLKCIKY